MEAEPAKRESEAGAERGPGGEAEAEAEAGERGVEAGAESGPEGEAERGVGLVGEAGAAAGERGAGAESGPEGEAERGAEAGGSGPEGEAGAGGSKRLALFSAAMETTLEKMLQTASFERFAQSYQPVYTIQPQFTNSVYKQLTSQLQTSIREEINQISKDGLFERALPKLDQLEKESKERSEPAWRPSGSPDVDLRSHSLQYLLRQKEYLQLKMKRVKEENTALAQSVRQGRAQIERLRAKRDEQCQGWQECSEICQQLKLGEQ